jgi:hypothetical protein
MPATSVTPWPNGLGWDVGDVAEVWRVEGGLAVHVFLRDDQLKTLLLPDTAVDPVSAVQLCITNGRLVEE